MWEIILFGSWNALVHWTWNVLNVSLKEALWEIHTLQVLQACATLTESMQQNIVTLTEYSARDAISVPLLSKHECNRSDEFWGRKFGLRLTVQSSTHSSHRNTTCARNEKWVWSSRYRVGGAWRHGWST